MNGREVGLVIFVGVCLLLVGAAIVMGFSEQQLGQNEQNYSASIEATPTLSVESADDYDQPVMPAQFDEGADPPTAVPATGTPAPER